MRPRGRAVNGWVEMGPDPENRCPFSLIPVTSLHGTMAYYLYYHTSLVSCFLFPDLSILLLITCCHGYGRPCTS